MIHSKTSSSNQPQPQNLDTDSGTLLNAYTVIIRSKSSTCPV